MRKDVILSVKDLSVSFRMYDRGLEQYDLQVISNLTLDVRPGEIVAIAGSSGSGKVFWLTLSWVCFRGTLRSQERLPIREK